MIYEIEPISKKDLNEPMVAINSKLGFERKSVYTDFILDISAAVGKLRPDK